MFGATLNDLTSFMFICLIDTLIIILLIIILERFESKR